MGGLNALIDISKSEFKYLTNENTKTCECYGDDKYETENGMCCPL